MASSKRKISTANKKKASSKVNATKQNKVVKDVKSSMKNVDVAKTAPKNGGFYDMLVQNKMRILNIVIVVLTIFFSFTLVDLFVQYLNNDFSVAVINGERVRQSDFEQRLIDRHGKTTLEQIINEEIVKQEAKEQGIEVSEEEIDEMLQKTKDQFPSIELYEEALEKNNLTEETVRDELKLTALAQKLVVSEPTEEELEAFFESTKALYFNEGDTYEANKEIVKEIYIDQKFAEDSGIWLESAKNDASIVNNLEEKPEYGLLTITRKLIDSYRD